MGGRTSPARVQQGTVRLRRKRGALRAGEPRALVPSKVPARAIARYILHYTKPGDVVLDGFCGTGMTAVAAQLCTGRTAVAKAEIERDVPNAVWGPRYAIVCDLAPAATFIAANYLHTPAVEDLESRCDRAIEAVRRETEWMFVTSVGSRDQGESAGTHRPHGLVRRASVATIAALNSSCGSWRSEKTAISISRTSAAPHAGRSCVAPI